MKKKETPPSKKVKAAGVVMVCIGIIGIVLPIIPGWPFLILGLSILGQKAALQKYLNASRKIGKEMAFEILLFAIILEIAILLIWLRPIIQGTP